MYTQFASIGMKLPNDQVHPVFYADKLYPADHIQLITSNEPVNEGSNSVNENVKEITEFFSRQGTKISTYRLVLEEFWKNVSFLVEEIIKTEDKPVILNLSTGRRVFVSTMLIAGSFALQWMPQKEIVCFQTSRDYPTPVVFEPNPFIPDLVDLRMLESLDNKSEKITTTQLAKKLNKSQSTISNRFQKLERSGYIKQEGHKRQILEKGIIIRETMKKLEDKIS